MRTWPPVPNWMNQAYLVVGEDWDKATPDTSLITAGTSPVIFSTAQGTPSQGWVCNATISNGGRVLTSVTNKVGVWTFTTGATINSTVSAAYSQGNLLSSASGFNTTFVEYYETVMELPSVASVNTDIGLVGNWATRATQAAVFELATGTSANWFLYTQTPAGANTGIDTGIVATTAWHIFGFEHILQPAERWNFYLDGVLVGSSTTNLPGGLLMPGFFLRTNTAAIKSILIDDAALWVSGDINLAT